MRIILMAALALGLLTVQADAQGKSAPQGPSDKERAAADAKLRDRRDNEAAAKAAMQSIPDSKEKYDPWRSAR